MARLDNTNWRICCLLLRSNFPRWASLERKHLENLSFVLNVICKFLLEICSRVWNSPHKFQFPCRSNSCQKFISFLFWTIKVKRKANNFLVFALRWSFLRVSHEVGSEQSGILWIFNFVFLYYTFSWRNEILCLKIRNLRRVEKTKGRASFKWEIILDIFKRTVRWTYEEDSRFTRHLSREK